MSIYLAGVCSRENNFLFFEDPHSYVRIKEDTSTKQTNGHGARLLPSLLLAHTHTPLGPPGPPPADAHLLQSSAGLGQDVKLQPQSVSLLQVLGRT